jgi:hypothetical protein
MILISSLAILSDKASLLISPCTEHSPTNGISLAEAFYTFGILVFVMHFVTSFKILRRETAGAWPSHNVRVI